MAFPSVDYREMQSLSHLKRMNTNKELFILEVSPFYSPRLIKQLILELVQIWVGGVGGECVSLLDINAG